MTASRSRPSSIAFHEAGHAAIALRLGWQIVSAGRHERPVPRSEGEISLGSTIIRAPAGLRRVPRGWRQAVEHELTRQKLLILAAGPIAQRLAYRRSRDGSGSDRRQAALLGATMCHAATGQAALERHAKEEATALVRQNWGLICELADAFEAGVLPGQRIKAMTAEFDLRRPDPPDLPTHSTEPAEEAPRRPSRRDLEAAALLALTTRLAVGDQDTAQLFERTLQAVAVRRNVDLEAARSKMAALAEAEAARSAWRPVPTHTQELA